MCIPISDWFTVAHMTYYNFTVRPSKCKITALQGRDIVYPPACSVFLATETKIQFCHDTTSFIINIEQNIGI